MRTTLTFFGGADEVTGSRHFLQHGATNILLDCGLFQGHRHEAIEKNRQFPFDLAHLSAVLLSHAHIDHSGGLPLLARKGFKNPIHCTRPTADLCAIMLMDSAFLQEEDAKFFNKIHSSNHQKIEPLYTQEDAKKAISLLTPHDVNVFFTLGKGLRARFLNAGHVLGSAMIELELDLPKGKRHLLFTGDLGRRHSILMKPPTVPGNIDTLLIESTYGNRTHEPTEEVEKIFVELVRHVTKERGRILIPSFALERSQEIIFILEKLRREKRIPPIHLYVDSPMATNITEIFNKHLDNAGLSDEFKKYVSTKGNPFGFGIVRYVRSVEESKNLNELPGQKIILAGSGMCEGGRILHHLRNNIDKDDTTVLLVGYQANGTLGRRLAQGAEKVKIFGMEHSVRAHVRQLHNFSSHADQSDLLWFIHALTPRPRKIFLVHGDGDEKQGLKDQLHQSGFDRVETPRFGDEFELT